jgi:hypothetical protein
VLSKRGLRNLRKLTVPESGEFLAAALAVVGDHCVSIPLPRPGVRCNRGYDSPKGKKVRGKTPFRAAT